MAWRQAARSDSDAAEGLPAASDEAGISIDPHEALTGGSAAADDDGGMDWRTMARRGSVAEQLAPVGDGAAAADESDSSDDNRGKRKKKKKSRKKRGLGDDDGDGAAEEDGDGAAAAGDQAELDPEAAHKLTMAEIRAASLANAPHLTFPRYAKVPTWLSEWADLKLLIEFEDDDRLPASAVVQQRAAYESSVAQQLATAVERRIDGGTFGMSATLAEQQDIDADPSLRYHNVPVEESAFWLLEDAARNITAALQKYLADRAMFLQSNESTIGPPFQQGHDGAQAWPELDLSEKIRKQTCFRFIAQDLFVTPSIGSERHDTAALLSRDYFSVPTVHSTFVCGKGDGKPDNGLLREVSPFSENEALLGTLSHHTLRRVITVNMGLFRFVDHPMFWNELSNFSALLTAYTRYRLLVANLLPAKSRAYYEELLNDLEQAHGMLVREVGPLTAEASATAAAAAAAEEEAAGSKRKKKKSKKTKAAAAAEAEAAGSPTTQDAWNAFQTEGEKEERKARLLAIERDLTTVRERLRVATDDERALLEAMWRAWGHVQNHRTNLVYTAAARGEKDVHAKPKKKGKKGKKGKGAEADDGDGAAGDGTATATETATASGAGDATRETAAESSHPPIRLSFALRNQAGEDYVDGQDILQFRPALTPSLPSGEDDPNPAADAAAAAATATGIGSALPTHVVASVFARHTTGHAPAFVGRTDPIPLDSAFSAGINAVFELHAAADPQDIIIKVHDYPTNRLITTFTLPPALSSTTRLLDGIAYGDPQTSVQMTMSTSWMTASGLPYEAVEDLFVRGEADPLDPRNAPLLGELRKRYGSHAGGGADGRAAGGSGGGGGTFKRSTDADIAPAPYEVRDERLRLMSLRDRLVRNIEVPRNAFEAKLMTVRIPATEFETKQLVRRLKLECMDEEAQVREAVNSDAELSMGGRDEASQKRLLALWHQRLRHKKMRMKVRKPQDEERLGEIMTIPPAPTIGKLIDRFKNIFIPKSKLRPEREEPPEEAEVQKRLKRGQCDIVVHAMKAEGMPLRIDGTPTNVIAELHFVAYNDAATPQPGPNPSWFETLKVPFRPPDFDKSTLSIMEDMIIVNFYDLIAVDIASPDATSHEACKTVQFRQERRYLGTVEMPFYSVFETERSSIEGQFTVSIPRLIMGYTVPANAPTATLYFSVWPPIPTIPEEEFAMEELAQQVRALYPTREQSFLYDAAFKWKAQMESQQKAITMTNPLAGRRNFMPFVTGMSGEPVLISRYILATGIRTPGSITSLPQAIRFVSLLPFVVDLASGEDKDVWSTMSEFFEAGGGDYEELALLLLHLLRRLTNEPTFIVIGQGDIYREATFVLTIVSGNWMIIDPRTGDVFKTEDPRCGLSEVSMVVSHNQVWGNVQLSGTPYRMVWDMDDARAWKPMFTQTHDAMLPSLPSVQRSSITIGEECTPELEVQVETEFKRKLQNLLREWRKDRGLRFDKGIARYLRTVLAELEKERNEFASFHQPTVDAEQNSALNNILQADFEPIGYPVQRSYVTLTAKSTETTMTDLFRAVRETAVHEVGAQHVRYAVATYVKGYTKDVFAVWAYVVALVPLSVDGRARQAR